MEFWSVCWSYISFFGCETNFQYLYKQRESQLKENFKKLPKQMNVWKHFSITQQHLCTNILSALIIIK